MDKKRILIIDDEKDFCLLLKSFFTNKEVEIDIAHTLATGLNTMEEKNPDIVFLDNNLPDGLGWDQVTNIIARYPHLELNLVSAYGIKDFAYLESYPVKFWEKPINVDELNKYVTAF